MAQPSSLGSAIPITLSDPQVWQKLIATASEGQVGLTRATLPSGGTLYIISMNEMIRMIPFARTAEELFEATARREAVAGRFLVTINGPTYGLTVAGQRDALFGSDPVDPRETLQEGRVVRGGQVIAGRPSNMYYIANYSNRCPAFEFGSGEAPAHAFSALGNMGPLLINGMKYGPANVYEPPQTGAIQLGQPAPEHAPFLKERSNSRFAAMAALSDPVGKIALAYSMARGQLLILVQPHGTPGVSIRGLRVIVEQLGCSSAVYLDGSDSVFLMFGDQTLIAQGSNKNETNVVGVGFVY